MSATTTASKTASKTNARHKFVPAEETHKNGHPKCKICGDEPTESGYCNEDTSHSIFGLIERQEVSTDDFNNFITEAFAKSTKERVQRRARLKPGEPLRPVDHDAKKKADHSLQHEGDNDPTKTRRGANAVKRRGDRNRSLSHRFREAVEFVNTNGSKTIEECEPLLQTVEDMDSLNKLVTRLLSTPKCPCRS
jgi:hypothetical protein